MKVTRFYPVKNYLEKSPDSRFESIKLQLPQSLQENHSLSEDKGILSVYSAKEISPLYFKARALPVISKPPAGVDFEYKPVASKPPVTDFVGEYEDLDRFCELFCEKLNSMLLIPKEEDIENLIARLIEKTGASRKTVLKVLYKLTAFSKYDSLETIKEAMIKNNVTDFHSWQVVDNYNREKDYSSNSALSYLAKKFRIHPRFKNAGAVLDDIFLQRLEEFKKSKNLTEKNIFQKVHTNIIWGKIVFFDIEGWDVKCSDGAFRSANMFSGSGFLEPLALDVIKRMQAGESLDEILHSGFDSRLREIFENDGSEIQVVKISKKPPRNLSAQDIVQNLSPKEIQAEKIKQKIKEVTLIRKAGQETMEAIMKYLDELALVFSIDSLVLALKNLHQEILKNAKEDGYKPSEIVYIIPEQQKSFSLITYMFAKINGIPPENIEGDFSKEKCRRLPAKRRLKVVLDDISATGTTQNDVLCSLARNFGSVFKKTPVYYATPVVCDEALEKDYDVNIKEIINIFEFRIPDFSEIYKSRLCNYLYEDDIEAFKDSFKETNFRLLDIEDIIKITDVLTLGYLESGLVCAFPYMVPDNDSNLSGLIFSDMVYSPKVKEGIRFIKNE